MIVKCARPECSALLQHGEGRFFRFQSRSDSAPRNSHCVEHFWLCGECAEIYTLEYRSDRGVLMRVRLPLHPQTSSLRLIASASPSSGCR